MSRFLLDISPLRQSRAFRYAYAARTATVLVTGMLMVAASIQLFEMTGSSIAVAGLNASMAIPMVLALMVGGVLSDRMDRRKLMLYSRSVYVFSVSLFLINALLPSPTIWLIYLAATIGGAAGGISVPAMMSATPALVGREHLAAAAALSGLSMQIGGVIGPSLAGLIIAGPGLIFCYVIVLAAVLTTPFFLKQLPALPPKGTQPQQPAIFHAFIEGFTYMAKQPLLRSLLLIDLTAVVLATPLALLPEWGTQVLQLGPEATGLLYSAPAVGATLMALSSGWTKTVKHPGRFIIAAVMLWGAAVFALSQWVWLPWSLLCLACMGAADTVSKILRMALVQKHTPDHLLGRMSSLWMTQSALGTAVGNMQMGVVSRWSNPTTAFFIGGGACFLLSSAFAWRNRSLKHIEN
ncbi:enterobactin transporter EntS [Paenalcaligenes sp.]|uniref:enterobactin transporter EntS n=1 Tax=Paenalcaligenes sp. TaxID=1966342 RepID=UPI002612201A|nr:enterobactin transporter EntS [Paenalcaligenes sp.]